MRRTPLSFSPSLPIPPLFFVRNWKKEEFQLRDSEGEKRKTNGRTDGQTDAERNELTCFEEEERRIEYGPSFSTSRFGDSRLIYNSISICSKRGFEKKTNMVSLGFLVNFFFFFFSFKGDSLEITMMFNYRFYGGYILARMYTTSFISVILITRDVANLDEINNVIILLTGVSF